MPNDVFSHLKIQNTVYDVKDTTARSDVASLADVVDTKVPQTREVNGHALSSNVTVKASDIPFVNTGTQLTGDDLQETTEELDTRLYALEQGGGSGWTITYSATPDEKLTISAS